jgi:SAM-dependent methyltransferase
MALRRARKSSSLASWDRPNAACEAARKACSPHLQANVSIDVDERRRLPYVGYWIHVSEKYMPDVVDHTNFGALLRHDPRESFTYIDPPFNFNHADIAKYPPEVTGLFLLNSLSRRLGWNSLSGRRLLDFGCGVRFARTIVNLAIDIDLYAGVDVNKEAISWLQSEISDPRFCFEHLDMFNPMYRAIGSKSVDIGALQRSLTDFDAACMFSVITHQAPEESSLIFAMLYSCVKPGGSLYFTAFIDEASDGYVELDSSHPRHFSAYRSDFLIELVRNAGWIPEATYLKSSVQQAAFVCRKPIF